MVPFAGALMRRFASLLLMFILALGLLAPQAEAQEKDLLSWSIAGLDDLEDNLSAIQSADISSTIYVRHQGRHRLPIGFAKARPGTKLTIRVKARHHRGQLAIRELRIKGNKSFRMGEKDYNSLTITRKGHLKCDIDGGLDMHITRVRKRRDGSFKLAVNNKPDVTVKPNGKMYIWGFIKVGRLQPSTMALLDPWPPTLESVLGAPKSKNDYGGRPAFVRNVSRVLYNGTMRFRPESLGRVRKKEIRIRDLRMSGGELSFSGSLWSNGRELKTYGKRNHLNATLAVRARGVETEKVSMDKAKGTVTASGSYSFTLPGSPGADPSYSFHGPVAYYLKGERATVDLPEKGRVSVDNLQLSGSGQVKADEDDFSIYAGRYHLEADGPVTIEDLEVAGRDIPRVVAAASFRADGNYSLRDGDLTLTADLEGTISEPEVDHSIIDVLRTGRLGEDPNRLRVGEISLLPDGLSSVSIDGEGRARVPLGDKADEDGLDYEFEGDLGFDLAGRDLAFATHNGIGVKAERANIEGKAHVKADTEGATVRDGEFRARITGEGEGTNIRTKYLDADRLPLDLDLTSEGTFSLDGDQFRTRSRTTGTARVREATRLRWDGIEGDVKEGSVAEVDIVAETAPDEERGRKFAVQRVEGRADYHLQLGNADVEYDMLRAAIEGEGNVDVTNEFKSILDEETGRLNMTEKSGTIKTDLTLRPGTTVTWIGKDGNEMTVDLQGESAAAFDVGFGTDEEGGVEFTSVEKTNINLVLGQAEGKLAGVDLSAPGKKEIELTDGRIVFLENGMDIYGDLKVHIHGDPDRPTLKIRW